MTSVRRGGLPENAPAPPYSLPTATFLLRCHIRTHATCGEGGAYTTGDTSPHTWPHLLTTVVQWRRYDAVARQRRRRALLRRKRLLVVNDRLGTHTTYRSLRYLYYHLPTTRHPTYHLPPPTPAYRLPTITSPTTTAYGRRDYHLPTPTCLLVMVTPPLQNVYFVSNRMVIDYYHIGVMAW